MQFTIQEIAFLNLNFEAISVPSILKKFLSKSIFCSGPSDDHSSLDSLFHSSLALKSVSRCFSVTESPQKTLLWSSHVFGIFGHFSTLSQSHSTDFLERSGVLVSRNILTYNFICQKTFSGVFSKMYHSTSAGQKSSIDDSSSRNVERSVKYQLLCRELETVFFHGKPSRVKLPVVKTTLIILEMQTYSPKLPHGSPPSRSHSINCYLFKVIQLCRRFRSSDWKSFEGVTA